MLETACTGSQELIHKIVGILPAARGLSAGTMPSMLVSCIVANGIIHGINGVGRTGS